MAADHPTIAVYTDRTSRSTTRCTCGRAGRPRLLKARATQDAWAHFTDTKGQLSALWSFRVIGNRPE